MLGYGFTQRGAPEQLWMGRRPPWPRWRPEPASEVPEQFRDEVQAWVAALREWGELYGSLGEVTSDDVKAAIDRPRGLLEAWFVPARCLLGAVRGG